MKKIIIATLVMLIIGGGFWFYWDYKETQKSVVKVESKLVPQGFEKFYQKKGNKFCIDKVQSEQEQEAIAQDMLWVLKEGDYRKAKRVECEDGIGIEVK